LNALRGTWAIRQKGPSLAAGNIVMTAKLVALNERHFISIAAISLFGASGAARFIPTFIMLHRLPAALPMLSPLAALTNSLVAIELQLYHLSTVIFEIVLLLGVWRNCGGFSNKTYV